MRWLIKKLFAQVIRSEVAKVAKELQYYHDTTVGLWCVDQNPKEVDIDWIRENAFQLEAIGSDSLYDR